MFWRIRKVLLHRCWGCGLRVVLFFLFFFFLVLTCREGKRRTRATLNFFSVCFAATACQAWTDDQQKVVAISRSCVEAEARRRPCYTSASICSQGVWGGAEPDLMMLILTSLNHSSVVAANDFKVGFLTLCLCRSKQHVKVNLKVAKPTKSSLDVKTHILAFSLQIINMC